MPPWMQFPHRRFNPLKGEWVLVSPHRATRPWQGQVEETPNDPAPQYDPSCYLCPGNARAQGVRNPAYDSTFVFDNDFPALLADGQPETHQGGPLLTASTERGVCRVLCFSPRHDLSLSTLELDPVEAVVKEWAAQTRGLFSLPFIQNVQIFENRGAMSGASNPHPHCQIWASESVPDEILKESVHQSEYWRKRRTCMLCDYLASEMTQERLLCSNEMFAAFIPFWAVWPFEAIVIGAHHVPRLYQMSPLEHRALGDILKKLTTMYDALFKSPFPYTMGFHQAPKADATELGWHMHAHFYPPLLRSATIRKFMVGYELLAGPQRDLTPEEAARRLREAAD